MLAQRNRLLSALVGESNAIFGTLGARRAELARVIWAASKILSVTGSRTAQIAEATRQLPAVIAQGGATSQSIAVTAQPLDEALTRLAPAATAFAGGLRETRRAIPALNLFLGAIASLVRDTLTPSRELATLTAHLGDGVGQAVAGYQDLTQVIEALIEHEKPISEFSDAISGALSTQDSYGVLGRVKFIGIQPPTAEDLGLSPAAARASSGRDGHSQLQLMLATALDRLCRGTQPLACVLALATPGLPGSLVKRGPS
jgi:ABC-type transporter Mla subunit MlaD